LQFGAGCLLLNVASATKMFCSLQRRECVTLDQIIFMKIKISPPNSARESPVRLLLPQFCSVNPPASDLHPQLLSLRAIAMTTLIANIVEQRGYFHGGINE
jgi:hypothetical protein